jgi:hypothetical protein
MFEREIICLKKEKEVQIRMLITLMQMYPCFFDLHNIFHNKGDTVRRVKSDTFATLVMCMRVYYLLGVKQ